MTETLKPVVVRVAILNLSYFVVEFYFAHRFNSVALLSDSLDFLEDASVNILIFLAFSLSVRWRKRLSYIFAGGYSAGYYGYIWSEVLDADTVEWFKENGGLTRKNGDHFRKALMSRGGSVDSMQMFRNFRGRDAEIEPLLRRRGLVQDA